MSLLNTLLPSIARQPGRNASAPAGDLGPTVRPAHEVRETAEAYGLTVHLPGVTKDGLELTVGDGELRLVARRAWKQPDGWTALHRETADLPFELVLAHDNALAADKVQAELKDGVLRVSLPKAEALKPRKIAVS
jgi:HSP20 family protein